MTDSVRIQLESVAAAALASVHGGRAVERFMLRDEAGDLVIDGRPIPAAVGLWVVAIGKAGVAMTRAVERIAGDRIVGGLAIAHDGQTGPLPERISFRSAGHPLPDVRGESVGRELLDLVARIPRSDVLLVLLSGGASALACVPDGALELRDLVEMNRRLLGCGANIREFNTVRKHCTAVSGGRLALAASCDRIEVLTLSDVPGDDPETIGSGPCEGDATRYADAVGVLKHFRLWRDLPSPIISHLEAGMRGEIPESPKPGDPRLDGICSRTVARNADARRAALRHAIGAGIPALDLGEVLLGEARQVGCRLAALARCMPSSGPRLLVAGGETVVTVKGGGRGGRSQELALAAGLEWARKPPTGLLAMLAVGSDGRDGPTDAAGAYVDSDLVSREPDHRLGDFLDRNDAHGYFDPRGGLIRIPPTHTNVMDLVLIFVSPEAESPVLEPA